jgi:hypothetical protein
MTPSGFQEQEWDCKPNGRGNLRAKSIWVAFRLATGIPPSLMVYLPPNRWVEGEDGENKEWRNQAEWVIHHKWGRFTFRGKGKTIAENIRAGGFLRKK